MAHHGDMHENMRNDHKGGLNQRHGMEHENKYTTKYKVSEKEGDEDITEKSNYYDPLIDDEELSPTTQETKSDTSKNNNQRRVKHIKVSMKHIGKPNEEDVQWTYVQSENKSTRMNPYNKEVNYTEGGDDPYKSDGPYNPNTYVPDKEIENTEGRQDKGEKSPPNIIPAKITINGPPKLIHDLNPEKGINLVSPESSGQSNEEMQEDNDNDDNNTNTTTSKKIKKKQIK